MKRISFFVVILLIITATGCHENASYDDDYRTSEYVENDVPASNKSIPPPMPPSDKMPTQKLIKIGRLAFEVQNLSATHAFIVSELQKVGGYMAHDEEHQGYNRINHELVVRLPAESFDRFLASLSSEVSQFDEKFIEVRDVTEQFVDLSARLKAKHELEDRYLDLLDRAKTVEDVLHIERELNAVRTDIEAMTGRLRVMQNQISYSTLTISYYTTETVQAQGFGSKLGQNFNSGWEGIVRFVLGLVRVWPLLLVFAMITIIVRHRWKRKKVSA